MVAPAFVLHVYNDEPQAERLLRQLRQLYPEAAIALIGDGVDSPALRQLAEELSLHYTAGQRLKTARMGGAWLERMLRIGMELPGDFVIRLDPDSWVWRRFRSFPKADLFGTVVGFIPQHIQIVRGGCVGWSKEAIAKVLDSGVLGDACYTLNPDYYAYWSNGELLSSACYITGHVIRRLNLEVKNWGECRVCASDPEVAALEPGISRPRWAATHPHKQEG